MRRNDIPFSVWIFTQGGRGVFFLKPVKIHKILLFADAGRRKVKKNTVFELTRQKTGVW